MFKEEEFVLEKSAGWDDLGCVGVFSRRPRLFFFFFLLLQELQMKFQLRK